jgi:hypothetical protein
LPGDLCGDLRNERQERARRGTGRTQAGGRGKPASRLGYGAIRVLCRFRGNKSPSKSVYITGATTAKNPMNLFGPCGVYTYNEAGRRMQSAGVQEFHELREGR